MSDYILEMRNVVKEYSGVRVLQDVSFCVKKGEIHALCGENGAGKSTMMKILSGVIPENEFSGDVLVDGEKVAFRNIAQSENAGIAIIYQELALAQDLDVCENIYMGRMPVNKLGIVDWNQAYVDTEALLKELTLDQQGINGHSKVGDLSIGQQSLVEVAKALSKNAKILILDEPTSALTEREVVVLLNIVRKLKERDVTCIYISHKLEEVMELADSISILRDGSMICTKDRAEMTEEDVIKYMVGREIKNRYPYTDHKQGEVLLEVKNYSVYNQTGTKKLVDNVSFSVRAGEVLGISGLMGSGRSELVTSLFGCMPGKAEGTVLVNGKEVNIRNANDAKKHGIALITEDRKHTGLMLGQSVLMNTTIANLSYVSDHGIINQSKEITQTQHYTRQMSLKAPSIESAVRSLSGGNQQKVVIAKWLMTQPRIVIMDEPTRGVDVGAKLEIYEIMNYLLDQGCAIVMISSEMPEVLGMSDRIMVMHEGVKKGEFSHNEATQEKLLACSVLQEVSE